MEAQFTFTYQDSAPHSSSHRMQDNGEDLAETSMLAHRVVSAHSNPSPPPSPSPGQEPNDMLPSSLLNPSELPGVSPFTTDTIPSRSATPTPIPATPLTHSHEHGTPRSLTVLGTQLQQNVGQVTTETEQESSASLNHGPSIQSWSTLPGDGASDEREAPALATLETVTPVPASPSVTPTPTPCSNQNLDSTESFVLPQSQEMDINRQGSQANLSTPLSEPGSALEAAKVLSGDRGRPEHAGSSSNARLRSLSPKSSDLLLNLLPGEPHEPQITSKNPPRNPISLPQFPSFNKSDLTTDVPMSLRTNSPIRSAPPVRFPSPARYTSPVRPNERTRFPSPSKTGPVRFVPPPSVTRPLARLPLPSTPSRGGGPSLPTRAPSTPLTTQPSNSLRLPHRPTLLRTPLTSATPARLPLVLERSRSLEPAAQANPTQQDVPHEGIAPMLTIPEKNTIHTYLGTLGEGPPPNSPQKPQVPKPTLLKQTKSRIPRIGAGSYSRAGVSRLPSQPSTSTKTPSGKPLGLPRSMSAGDGVRPASAAQKAPVGPAVRLAASSTLKRKREAPAEETAPRFSGNSSSSASQPPFTNGSSTGTTVEQSSVQADQLMDVDASSPPELPPPSQVPEQQPLDPALAQIPMGAGASRALETPMQTSSSAPSTRRTSRLRQGSPERAPAVPSVGAARPRRPRATQDLDSLSGFSIMQLRTLTNSNTAKNEKYSVAKLETEVIRKEGNRPGSPAPKVLTIVQREKTESKSQRNQRAERRSRRDSKDVGNSDGASSDLEETEWDGVRHRRGAGEEEDYETPERPQRPQKKTKSGDIPEDDAGDRAEERRVRWNRGLFTATFLDTVHPRTHASRQSVDLGSGCLAKKAKLLKLDTLGNLANTDGPLPGLVPQHVVVKKFVYDDDLPPPPAPSRATRSKSKKK